MTAAAEAATADAEDKIQISRKMFTDILLLIFLYKKHRSYGKSQLRCNDYER